MTNAAAADLIVSTNDAKYQRVAGSDTYVPHAQSDTLDLIDASTYPPTVIATVQVDATIAGPPQAVAITPDGKLAIVSAPSRYDAAQGQPVFGNYLQLVALESRPPRVVRRVEVDHHPQGIAINPAGTLLLAATQGGTVEVFEIRGLDLISAGSVQVGEKRLAGIAFTPDGKAALVAMRDEQGAMVLDIDGTQVTTQRERVSTGVAPYSVDVDGQGQWAVIGNVGLVGLAGDAGKLAGDTDSITLVDISRRPFRAVQHLSVPSVPEGLAISPDGRWIVALCMDGSNLKPGNPGRRSCGKIVLFEIGRLKDSEKDSEKTRLPARFVNELPGGEAGQGVVFTADSRYVLAQFNVEKQIAVYAIDNGELRDTRQRIDRPGGPSSIRSKPR